MWAPDSVVSTVRQTKKNLPRTHPSSDDTHRKRDFTRRVDEELGGSDLRMRALGVSSHAAYAQRVQRTAANGGEGPATARGAALRRSEMCPEMPAAASFRQQRQRRAVGVVCQASAAPPATHSPEPTRPTTSMRPVSEAAVNSSVALKQFVSSGGANREPPPGHDSWKLIHGANR